LFSVETRSGDPDALPGDALVHFFFEGDAELPPPLAQLNEKLDGALSDLISGGEAKGKLHETHLFHTSNRLPTRRVLLVGAGKRDDLAPERVERLFGQAARKANGRGWATLIAGSTTLSAGNLPVEVCLRAAATGAVVALGRGDLYKTGERPEDKLERLILADPEMSEDRKAEAEAGRAVGEGINFARELVYQPPADMTPTILGERARALGERFGFETTILNKRALEELGANALLAVSWGSSEEPRMVRLRYGNFSG